MIWPVLPISRLAKVVGGGTPSKANDEYWNGQIPWVSPKDMVESEIFDTTDHITQVAVETSATRVVPEASVLIVVRSGILARKLPVSITRTAVTLNQDMKAFLCADALMPEFLAYFLAHKEKEILSSFVKRGATVHSIDMRRFSMMAIPVPAMAEQRRIVELLDEANQLRKLRREADAKGDRILPALFLKMFGDPATNPMGWKMCPLRKAIASIDPGWSAQSEPRTKEEGELGVLKVSAVTSGRFRPSEHKAVTKGLESRTLVIPRKGDLIFSRANTRELVAATCLVEEDHPNLFLSDKLWRITPDPKEATSLFLKMLFSNEFIRDQIRSKASGSSGSMLNVSQESVLRSEVPLPPVNRQERFTSLGWNILPIMRSCSTVAARLETLWDELLHGAFSGQLTANWRAAHMQELLVEMQQQARLLSLPSPESLEASS